MAPRRAADNPFLPLKSDGGAGSPAAYLRNSLPSPASKRLVRRGGRFIVSKQGTA
ncbi:Uncharacterized protein ChrSV_0502 [Chromobacterium vaccinii]|nr:Uncharacterized protein ChrSW_0502 [Chromobacterium vaccinii]QND87961.1 Uncharacterized protein ChrSV_0502 [Chromobacterium vaccinii]